MGHPLICKCGYIKLWHGGTDDPEVSQHFIDWYTYSHVLHGILLYVVMCLFIKDRPSIALGLLVAVSFAAIWEILENAPFIVRSYARTTIVRDYAGDSIINSIGDVLATILGVVLAARLPMWLSASLLLAGFYFPHDRAWFPLEAFIALG